MSSTKTAGSTGFGDRFLTAVERAGNKLPQPFNLFLILFLITGVVSTGLALGNVTVVVPGSDDPIAIRGLFTGEGLAWFTTNIGANYIGFPPLVTVVTILLAIGIAEKTGFLSAAIRTSIGAAPRWLLPYAVAFIGVVGSIMADSSFVVIPPLAAMAFKAAGRHPMAGLLGGFAAVGAGYSTSIFPTSLDALFAGITTAVIPTVPALEQLAAPVNPLSNYYYNVVSSIVLAAIAGFIIDKVLEPRMNRLDVPRDEVDEVSGAREGGSTSQEDPEHETAGEADLTTELSPLERKGLVAALISLLVLAVVVLAAVLVPMSPWRNEEGGFLPESPLLDSIVFVVFTFFAVGGFVYGKVARTIDGFGDVPRLMGAALKDMVPFLVLAFILGQFIALFDWSGVGSGLAVAGADGLKSVGFTGLPVIFLFVLLCSLLNLFIVSGSSMWTLMAAVFVPLFGILGYEPGFIQAAFRIGDSATQIITPLNPYMIVLLTFVRKYEPEAGLGTLMARLVPFVIPFWVAWALILLVFFQLDLPLGPGNDILIQQGNG